MIIQCSQRLPQLFRYQGIDEELELVVHVANFTHKWGGLTNGIYMGLPRQISRFVNRLYAAVLFLTGVILVMALYHLFLFIKRRKDRASLFFSLFCFLVFFWYLFTGDYLFFHVFLDFPLGLGIRLNYFSLFGLMPCFVLFIDSVFSGCLHKIFIKIISGIGFFMMVLALVTPLKLFTSYTLTPYYICAVIAAVLVIFIIIRSLLLHRPGAWLALTGFLIFMAAALYDMAANRKIIEGSPLGPFIPAGLFVFILIQSFILANRFSLAYKTLDELTVNLEKKIRDRTEELHTAREKLYQQEKLAAIGTLAGGISHEIFNPLSGISGPSGIIKKEITESNLKTTNRLVVIWGTLKQISVKSQQ